MLKEQPSSATTYLWQLYALLYKNVVLFKRNYFSSIVQLLAPMVCVMLFGMILAINGITKVDSDPQPIVTMGGSGKTLLGKCQVFDRAGGRFGFGKPIKNAPCITLVYAPKNDVTDRVMQTVAKRNGGLEMGTDILGFQDRDALVNYFVDPNYVSVFAGVVFNSSGSLSGRVKGNGAFTGFADGTPGLEDEQDVISYEVWYNETAEDLHFLGNAGMDSLAFESGFEYSSYILQVQRAVNEAIIVEHTGKEDAVLEMQLKRFPHVEGSNRQSKSSFFQIEALGSLFYLLGVMLSFIITLRQVVQEKDDKILDALRMMGLYESCYWLSWTLYYAVLLIPTTLLMIFGGKITAIPVFLYTDFAWLFLTLYLYLFAMAAFALGFSALVPNTKVAVMVGFFMMTVAIIFQLMVTVDIFSIVEIMYDPFKLSAAATNIINLYPPLLFAKIDKNMYSYTKVFQVPSNGTTREAHGSYLWNDSIEGGYQHAKLNTLKFDENGVNRSIDYEAGCKDGTLNGCLEHVESCYNGDYNCDGSTCYSPSCRLEQCSYDWSSFVSEAGCLAVPGAVFSSHEQFDYFLNSTVTRTSCSCQFSIPSDSASLSRMFGVAVFWLFFAWFVGQVLTYGHGRAEPLWFPLTPWYWLGGFGVKNPFGRKGKLPSPKQNVDQDVEVEEKEVQSGQRSDQSVFPVVMDGLVKDFGGLFSNAFRAVDGVTLSLELGSCFALLGHNGAGKTTAINMLSGMIAPSGGDCTIYGKSVRDSISSVRHEIGVCPQHDILWAQLTAREHLRFYGHFQGMTQSQIKQQGGDLLKQVHLDTLTRVAGNYSGGMRRRLSMTIAALGNKRIIFLDEPTTGLDPQNQRHVWDMINDLKKGRVVILTTHLMDEADMLGDRIGIMAKGRLVALGNPIHLKTKFGGNYKVSINPAETSGTRASIDKSIRSMIPGVIGCPVAMVQDGATGSMVYSIPPSSFQHAPSLFRWIDGDGSEHIKDWGLSQTSLEDVFVSLNEGTATPAATPIELQQLKAKNPKLDGDVDVALEVAEEEFQTEDVFERTFRGQVRGLFLKSATLQIRQRKTVFVQVAIPILLMIGLHLLIKLVNSEAGRSSGSDQSFDDGGFGECFRCLREEYYNLNDLIEYGQPCTQCAASGFNQTSLPEIYKTFHSEFTPLAQESFSTLEELKSQFPSEFKDSWFESSGNPLYNYCANVPKYSPTCQRFEDSKTSSFNLENPKWFTPYLDTISDQFDSSGSMFYFEPKASPRILFGFSSKDSALKSSVGSQCLPTTFLNDAFKDLQTPSCLYDTYPEFGKQTLDNSPICPVANISLVGQYLYQLSLGTGILGNYPTRASFTPPRFAGRFYESGQSVNKGTLFAGPRFCNIEESSAFDLLDDQIKNSADQTTAFNEMLLNGQTSYRDSTGVFATLVPLSAEGFQKTVEIFDDYFPSAGIVFSEADAEAGKLKFTYQSYFKKNDYCTVSGYPYVSVDAKLATSDEYSSCKSNSMLPSINRGRFGSLGTSESRVLSGLTSAMLRSTPAAPQSSLSGLTDPIVILGTRPLPRRKSEGGGNNDITKVVGGYISALFLPLATMFLLPVLVFHLVHEKEHKLRSSLLMMGMQMRVYWLVQYLFDLALSLLVMFLIYILGLILSLEAFTNQQFGIVIVLFVIWSNLQIAFAFFCSVFFSKTRNANILMYFLVLAASIGCFVLNTITFAEKPFLPAPGWYMWFPLFTYCRSIYLLTGRGYYWEDLDGTDELVKCWGYMIAQTVVLFLATFYLDIVLPKEFGVRRGPFFFIEDLFKCVRERSSVGTEQLVSEDMDDEPVEDTEALIKDGIDPDVVAERALVLDGGAANAPIRIINLKKRFGNFQAVDGVTMHMRDKSVTSLLGPNGAGKSTTISMLTGLYAPSSGEAYVDQKNIATEMELVHNVIGVCPQHDITWPELTVEEHLFLYARLKGVPRSRETTVVQNAVGAVKLIGHEKKRARQLSGGQRRRLSIAISFIGNPRVVFLDEPTTGVDPVTRTYVHDLVLREKKKRCIVLTTHLMSESEKLSDRIGIMAHGKLQTIGTANRLKQKYNEGFKIVIVVSDQRLAEKFVSSKLPGATLESQVNSKLTFQVEPGTKLRLSDVWELMDGQARHNGITDWQISATTLEDVFIQIASKSEAIHGTA